MLKSLLAIVVSINLLVPNISHAEIAFSHFGIFVIDINKSAAWYKAVFKISEKPVVTSDQSMMFLTWDKEHHRIALLKLESQTQPFLGLNHIAFKASDLAELAHIHERLASLNIEPVSSMNHGMTTSIYYQDPDGNGVEFLVDNFASEQNFKTLQPHDYQLWLHDFSKHPKGIPLQIRNITEEIKAGRCPDLFPIFRESA